MLNQAKTEVPGQVALIGEATCVRGSVRGEADLVVHGRIEGQVHIDRGLFIQPTGVVKADVVAESVVVQGVLVGSVIASQSVQIAAEGRVVGNISAPRFSMAEGALYRGHVETDESALQELATTHEAAAHKTAPRVAAFPRNAQPQQNAAPPRAPIAPPSFSRGAIPAPPPPPPKVSFKPLEVRPRAARSQPPAPPPPPPPFQTLLLREEDMTGGIPGDDDLTPQPALIGKRKASLKRKK